MLHRCTYACVCVIELFCYVASLLACQTYTNVVQVLMDLLTHGLCSNDLALVLWLVLF